MAMERAAGGCRVALTTTRPCKPDSGSSPKPKTRNAHAKFIVTPDDRAPKKQKTIRRANNGHNRSSITKITPDRTRALDPRTGMVFDQPAMPPADAGQPFGTAPDPDSHTSPSTTSDHTWTTDGSDSISDDNPNPEDKHASCSADFRSSFEELVKHLFNIIYHECSFLKSSDSRRPTSRSPSPDGYDRSCIKPTTTLKPSSRSCSNHDIDNYITQTTDSDDDSLLIISKQDATPRSINAAAGEARERHHHSATRHLTTGDGSGGRRSYACLEVPSLVQPATRGSPRSRLQF